MAVWVDAIDHDHSGLSDQQKRLYGCNGGTSTFTFEMGRYKVVGCPYRQIRPLAYAYIRAFNRFDKGLLPNRGGWLEQPAKFNDAVDIIQREMAEIHKKRMNTPRKR